MNEDGSVRESAREHLLTILAPGDRIALNPQFFVRAGTPAAEIVRFASEHDTDLIVMGTHGRGLVGHMVMGSVAEKVVRTAPCPVLTVRRNAGSGSGRGARRQRARRRSRHGVTAAFQRAGLRRLATQERRR